MTTFKEMDPALVLAAIKGHKDILTPEAERLSQLYQSKTCPRCNQSMNKEFDPRHVFSDDSVAVGRALLRCGNCQHLLDPHNGMVVEYGDASKVPTPQPDVPYIDPS